MEATNPYQAPQGNLTADPEEPGVVKFFSPSCRIGRLRYLSHSMLVTLASYAIIFPLMFLMAAASDMAIVFVALLGLTYIAVLAIFAILVIQRLHDLNQSGWLGLVMLVPLVNMFFSLYLLFWPGTNGRNSYGGQPPPNRWWHWTLGLTLPVIFVLGIAAAVALPAYQQYLERVQAAQQEMQ